MPRINRIQITAALLALAATALVADERHSRTVERTLTHKGGGISIDHSFGSIVVRGESGSDVKVRARIRSSDDEFAKGISVHTSSGPNGVVIRTDYPPKNRMKNLSFSVDYQIVVPHRASMVVKNKFGSTDVSGVHAKLQVITSHGSVKTRDIRGTQHIENAFGSIDAVESHGDLTVRDQNGSVRVSDVRGSLTVSNRFGSVAVNEIRGDLAIQNANGSVHSTSVNGNASITNAFGSVEARGIRGDASITNQNGKVELQDVGGSASVRNSFASTTLSDIRGSVIVNGQNMQVDARDIRGSLSIRTSFGSAFVHDAKGAVDVRTENGSIAVNGLRHDQCTPVSLHASFGSIKVSLPERGHYTVNARTTHGQLKSSLPIDISTATDTLLSGTLGKGTCPVNVTNNNGAITLEKD